jgi:hypothetical protein
MRNPAEMRDLNGWGDSMNPFDQKNLFMRLP